MLPGLGAVVLAFRVGADDGRLAPFHGNPIIGHECGVLSRSTVKAPAFSVVVRSFIVQEHVSRELDLIKQGFFPGTPVEIQDARHGFIKYGRITAI